MTFVVHFVPVKFSTYDMLEMNYNLYHLEKGFVKKLIFGHLKIICAKLVIHSNLVKDSKMQNSSEK